MKLERISAQFKITLRKVHENIVSLLYLFCLFEIKSFRVDRWRDLKKRIRIRKRKLKVATMCRIIRGLMDCHFDSRTTISRNYFSLDRMIYTNHENLITSHRTNIKIFRFSRKIGVIFVRFWNKLLNFLYVVFIITLKLLKYNSFSILDYDLNIVICTLLWILYIFYIIYTLIFCIV